MARVIRTNVRTLMLLVLFIGITSINFVVFLANPPSTLIPPGDIIAENSSLAPVTVVMPSGVSVQGNNLNFMPSSITVTVGVDNSIVWKNEDSVDHSATSNPGDPAGFDTGLVSPGTTSGIITLTVPGTYLYHCKIHPAWMKGKIVVLSASTFMTVIMTISYGVIGGGSGSSAPTFSYFTGGVSKTYKLTTTPTAVSVDAGSMWSVTNPLLGSTSSQRWEAQAPLSGSASTMTLVFTFYHQYLQTLSYSVTGGGSGSPPTYRANQFGSPTPVTLTNTASPNWFDSGSSWSITPNPLTGSTSIEQWVTTQKTSGTITGSSKQAFKYQHQFYLTMQVNPSGPGSASPNSGWQNAGVKVAIKATAKKGYKLLTWTGLPAGPDSYSGTNSAATVTMNEAITETANFGVIITITSNPTGSGYVMVDGVPVKTSQTFTWIIGSTHMIAAVSPVSCGSGCQYVFTAWSDAGTQSHTITVPSAPTTYKANFQKQFLLTINVNPQGAGTVNVNSGYYSAGQKITLTPTANTGHTFKSWKGTGSGSFSGINASPTITMNSAITETANFT